MILVLIKTFKFQHFCLKFFLGQTSVQLSIQRGNQQVTLLCKVLVGATVLSAVVVVIPVLVHKMTWLTYLNFISYTKLVFVIIKSAPQVRIFIYSETSPNSVHPKQRTCDEQQTKHLVPNVTIFFKLPLNSKHLSTTDKFFKTGRCPLLRGFTVLYFLCIIFINFLLCFLSSQTKALVYYMLPQFEHIIYKFAKGGRG